MVVVTSGVRSRRKIDLITLNVKLTLRGGEGLMGLGLTLRKNIRKNERNSKKKQQKRKMQKQLLPKYIYYDCCANIIFYNIHGDGR